MPAEKYSSTPNSGLLSDIDDIIRKHQNRDGALIDVLHDVQALYGYLPEQAINELLKVCPFLKVYGVANILFPFYLGTEGTICHQAL